MTDAETKAGRDLTLAEAAEVARDKWQAKYGKCTMCHVGDVPVKGLHRGKHKCGNAAEPPRCELCGKSKSAHIPDAGKLACPVQSMDESVPIQYFCEAGTVGAGPARLKLELKFLAAMHQVGLSDEWEAQERISIDALAELLASSPAQPVGSPEQSLSAQIVGDAIPFVERANGRMILNMTKREHVCEWQSSVRALSAHTQPATTTLKIATFLAEHFQWERTDSFTTEQAKMIIRLRDWLSARNR